jgi:hypothetical protein
MNNKWFFWVAWALWIATLLASFARADLADVPKEVRQENYVKKCPDCGEEHDRFPGSCVHASTITMLRWHGMDELADWWRENYHSGETLHGLTSKLDEAGLKYAFTDTGDVSFIEWAVRNRLVVGLAYKPSHWINLVDLTDEHAVLLDNNRIGEYEYIPRAEFEAAWKNQFWGVAVVLVYEPSPPWPRR